MFAGSASAAPQFPVRHSANHRHLVDAGGAPFPILGRTAWFVLSLAPADYRVFVDDTASRGFTSVELNVLNHDPRGNHPPFDGEGNRPFVNRVSGAPWDGALTGYKTGGDAPDFTTPNEKYWRAVDVFLAYCESKNLLVFLFPAYVGFRGGDQGWMREMVANGSARMRWYGAWVASRYRHQRNLVWMIGGDMGTGLSPFDARQTDVEEALVAGLQSVARESTQMSAEWSPESIGTDQPSLGASLTLNSVYSFNGDVAGLGRRAYARAAVEPSFLLEEPYDEEGPDGNRVNPAASQPVRRFVWEGWLSTIGGYIAGNGYVWPFRDGSWRGWLTDIRTALRSPGRHVPRRGPGWRDHLDTDGSRDLGRLNAFVTSIPWHTLVPSGLGGMRRLITSDAEVVAAASADGTLLVAYVPPGRRGSIAVDLRAMSGAARARWLDPTSGGYASAGQEVPNSGAAQFVVPGPNGAGGSDWVLVIDRAAVTTPARDARERRPSWPTPSARPRRDDPVRRASRRIPRRAASVRCAPRGSCR